MRLQDLINGNAALQFKDWGPELIKEVQERLAALGFLSGAYTAGTLDDQTKKAFASFKRSTHQTNLDTIGAGSAKLLLESKPPSRKLTLAERVVACCDKKGYTLERGEGYVNIIGIEGVELDGSPNNDKADGWNDVLGLLTFVKGQPKFLCLYKGTTEPGSTYTNRPLNPKGAARLQLGQQKNLWAVGQHRGYEAMQQVGSATVVRDGNRNTLRDDAVTVESGLGVNLHTTKTTGWKGSAGPSIGPWSAGCAVIKSPDEFLNFMKLVKQSAQYKANKNARFTFTLLWRDWL